MEVKISELERKTMEAFRQDLLAEMKNGTLFLEKIYGLATSMRSYQLALYVKYGIDVNEYDLSTKTGKFIKRLEEEKK